MSRFLGAIVYRTLWIGGGLVFLLPFSVKDGLARVAASFWFHIVRFRRHIILQNLALVFPRESQESVAAFQFRCEHLAERHLRHVVLTFLEMLERFHWDARVLDRRIRVEGLENSRPQREAGQGAFFLTAHLGNWELISLVGKLLHIRLAIITKALRNSFFDRVWVRSRLSYGLELLEESGSGLAIARGIRQGKAIGFILDQHTGEPHGIECEFLGLPAWCPKGLAILSTRLQAPILPAYLIREEDGNFTLHMEAPLRFPEIEAKNPLLCTESGSLTEAGLRYHISICNENMKKWILQAPDQYLWLHRRFKNILDYRRPLPWSP